MELTELTSFNVMAAFAMKIVGRGWILEWNQLEIGEFSSDSAKAVDLHRLWAHVFASGGSSENL